VDTLPLHYVVAEWLAPSGLDVPALPDGPTRRLIKEGPTARVYQVTLAPGAATDMHMHAAPGLTVLATSGMLAEEGSAPAARGNTGAGRWSWREAGYRHVLRNEGATLLIAYEIDW
jgi:quercetin dioxygenase-like cupin family protein